MAGDLLVGDPQDHSPHQSLAGAVYVEEDLITAYLEAVREVTEGPKNNDPSVHENTLHTQSDVTIKALGNLSNRFTVH